jgi:hypothetical protein
VEGRQNFQTLQKRQICQKSTCSDLKRHRLRTLIKPPSKKRTLTQLFVFSPLRECHFADQLWLYPLDFLGDLAAERLQILRQAGSPIKTNERSSLWGWSQGGPTSREAPWQRVSLKIFIKPNYFLPSLRPEPTDHEVAIRVSHIVLFWVGGSPSFFNPWPFSLRRSEYVQAVLKLNKAVDQTV